MDRRVLEDAATEFLHGMSGLSRKIMDQYPDLSVRLPLPDLPGDLCYEDLFKLANRAHVYEYPKADHTTDAVVLGLDLQQGTLKVLLIERGREGEPFYGCWALPGGFLNLGEDLDTCVRRELEEETGIKLSYLEQLYTFGRPDRDPRGRVITTAYLALVRPQDINAVAADDAAKAQWFSVDDLPPLAFDHAEIIQKGLERLKSKVQWQPVGMDLLPEEFTLTDLQQVYEIILSRLLDKRNFRRRMFKMGVLVPTGSYRSEKHRPASVYKFDHDAYRALQDRGIDFEV